MAGEFKKGKDSRRAPGGKRDNAGRPADWLKAECQKHAPELIKFLKSVANGEKIEQVVGNEGEIISVPAAVRDRIKAAELLLDRGYGKVPQAVDVTSGGKNWLEVLQEARCDS